MDTVTKNPKHVELKKKRLWCSLKNENVKNYLMPCKCLCCNKNYQKMFDKKLKKRFDNIYKFSNHDINKFLLL